MSYKLDSHDAECIEPNAAFTNSPSNETPLLQRETNADWSDHRSDDELVKAACAKSRTAFATLYRRYARTVHGVLLSRVHADDADDLVHDVFLRAMRKISAVRDAQAFSAWICTIARNLATDHLRTKRAHGPLPEIAQLHRNERQAAEEWLEVIRTLPEAYREPLILRLVEQMPGPEIARRTGMTEGSVRVNLHRGMRLLREQLGHGGEAQ